MDAHDNIRKTAMSRNFYWQPSVSLADHVQELRSSPNAEESSRDVYVKVSHWLEAGEAQGLAEEMCPVDDEAEELDFELRRGVAKDHSAAELYETTMFFDSTQTWDAIEDGKRSSKGYGKAGKESDRLSEKRMSGKVTGRGYLELEDSHANLERSPTNSSPKGKSVGTSSPSSEVLGYVTGLVVDEPFLERKGSTKSLKHPEDIGLGSDSECLTEAFTNILKNSWFRVTNDQEARLKYPGELVIALNAGGSLPAVSFSGIEYGKDQLFLGGDVLRTDEEISETSVPSLYQTARYGNVSYKLADLPYGEYSVDLHFAEIVFTNGPSGMRVFDVHIQGEKVISGLDIYAEVGSNKALILCGKTLVRNGTLIINFEGVIGNPTISAVSVRRAISSGTPIASQSLTNFEGKNKLEVPRIICTNTNSNFSTDAGEERDSLPPLMGEHKFRSRQLRKKAHKSVREYELKLEELKNECHEAWMSLQDANRKIEKLQSDIVCRSVTMDNLANAVRSQESEMTELKQSADGELRRWKTAAVNLFHEFEEVKANYGVLAKEMKDWMKSFPDTSSMITTVQALVKEHELLKIKYAEESQERRQLYNKVLELKGNIRVFCRCRPLSPLELASGAAAVVDFDAAKDNELIVRTGNSKKLFKFDCVFTPQDNQGEVFANTAPVVISVLDGYNVCIFAYGQTGTGKTFTMEGTLDNRGVNYRTLEELFHITKQRQAQFHYEISVSVLEVYNEQIRDLLAPPSEQEQPVKKLEIRQVAEGGHHVPGLLEAHVNCMEEVWEVLQSGSSARAVESTNANEHSSRSHCMLCVMVKGQNLLTGECTRSKLWLVDLAGSERVAKTDVHGERLREAQSINKSLSALGDVIAALTSKSSHIPFRNSKLTHLLQDSLGGDSKTLMFVQISPSEEDVGESLCSLNFASRVRGIELGPARKQLDSSELFKYKQLAERAKQEGKTKEEAVRKLEDTLRNTEVKLKVKEHLYQVLLDKVKEKDKLLADLEGQLAAEKKVRLAAQASLKEKGSQLEKSVGSKDVRGLPERRPLMDKTHEAIEGSLTKGGIGNLPDVTTDSAEEVKPQHDESDPQQGNDDIASTKSIAKTKIVLSRYNSPTIRRKRPMRASIASTYRINPATLASSFSSDESGADFPKENFRCPNNGREKHRSIISRPTAPALPARKKAVHFASPVFQKEKLGEVMSLGLRGEDDDPQSRSHSGPPYHERSFSLGGVASDSTRKLVGASKLRRISILRAPAGRFPASSSVTMGGAQRVSSIGAGGGAQRLLSVAAGAAGSKFGVPPQPQRKEKRWNQ